MNYFKNNSTNLQKYTRISACLSGRTAKALCAKASAKGFDKELFIN